ncbi:hypothetical protein IP78_02140 [Brevundimonas sp. AAP58]|uniref:holdfast anchor protein HfaD n=1 Tax=Brevundimonas sp. AAP58 TaxID=1523422 RepID=UPI0006B98DB9|nr:holdfast anchor protein HfaD [Brevundimonas sp. AAP58]KPF83442.1 hypothetical protein IP78_02140 [Brevundimonas sp. AAP58]
MARPAPIRLAGTIAATAMCVAAATEAFAQQQDSRVLNNQLQLGDVISGVTLNVEDPSAEVSVDNAARANTLYGAAENGTVVLTSSQEMQGDTRAVSELTITGDASGPVNVQTTAGANALSAAGYGADITIESNQVVGPSEVTASAAILNDTARLLGGASFSTSANANAASLGGTGTRVQGTVIQGSEAGVRSETFVVSQYIPAEAEFISESVGNSIGVNSTGASSQALTLRQRQAGDTVSANTSANSGNAWDLAGRARAVGNIASTYNQGGSVVTLTDQSNLSEIRASALVTSYDWGGATASAAGVGNQVVIGNNDRYLEIDNSQVNSGGVQVTSEFAGTYGYDAYVASAATGNAVTGYACSDCEGQMVVTNTQTNSGPVSATSTARIAGSARAVATSAAATGNAATFYVSRSGN